MPTLQISMPTLDPVALFEIGRRLAPLRDEGVLILGSGFTTHNLSLIDMQQPPDAPAPAWSARVRRLGRAARSRHVTSTR